MRNRLKSIKKGNSKQIVRRKRPKVVTSRRWDVSNGEIKSGLEGGHKEEEGRKSQKESRIHSQLKSASCQAPANDNLNSKLDAYKKMGLNVANLSNQKQDLGEHF